MAESNLGEEDIPAGAPVATFTAKLSTVPILFIVTGLYADVLMPTG